MEILWWLVPSALVTAAAMAWVSWVSRDGREGLTVPMNDPAALAAAANRLVHEPGLRPRLADADHRDDRRGGRR